MATVTAQLASRRMARFVNEARSRPVEATAALRADLTKAGGPLVERGPDGVLLLSFVYVGPGATVALYSGLVRSLHVDGVPMTRVPGTDVWHHSIETSQPDLCVCYCFLVDQPPQRLNVLSRATAHEHVINSIYQSLYRHAVADPHNPDKIKLYVDYHFPETERPRDVWWSALTLPGAPPFLWGSPSTDCDVQLTECGIRSRVFGDRRTVTVYTPPRVGGDARAVVYLTDGEMHLSSGMHHVLNNLILAGEIPPTMGVFVHNAKRMSRMVELACDPRLPEFFAEDVIPFVRRDFGAPGAPASVVAAGCSLGGLSSLWLAYRRPDVFGNVLSLSGSFWWDQATLRANDPRLAEARVHDARPEWLVETLAGANRLPLRVWLDAGTLETARVPNGSSILAANRRLHAVLQRKGYDVRHRERAGAHDWAGWRRAFADGLRFLLGTPEGGTR